MATQGRELLATRDGGRSWRVVSRGRRVRVLEFVTPRRGFALTDEDALLATADGGRTWSVAHRFPRVEPAGPFGGAVDFVDASHGWVAPLDERLYRTADAGRTWTRLSLPCGFVLGGVSFIDRSHGYAVCGGQPATIEQEKEFYATSDGGAMWTLLARTHLFGGPRPRPTDLPTTGHAIGLDFRSADVGFLITSRGGIVRTADGGRTWRQSLFTDDAYTVSSTSWAGPRRVFATYFGGNVTGLLRSDDAGAHWRQIDPRQPGPPTGPIAFATSRRGLGAGTSGVFGSGNAILATDNGGRSWRALGVVPRAVEIRQLIRVENHVLWALVLDRSDREFLVRSLDDGRHWQVVAKPRDAQYATISFLSASRGFLADSKGRVFATHDGGRSWAVVHRGSTWLPAQFFSPRKALAVVQYGLLRSSDGGRSWHRVALPPRVAALNVSVLDGRRWWVFGNVCAGRPLSRKLEKAGPRRCGASVRGALLQTRDGGRHWDLFELPIVLSGEYASFVSARVGFVNDEFEGGFYRTDDGGRTWRSVTRR